MCLCCFRKLPNTWDAEVDHMRPLARGGRDELGNLILAHPKCNREKHHKTYPEHWEWRVRVGLDEVNLGRKHGILDKFI